MSDDTLFDDVYELGDLIGKWVLILIDLFDWNKINTTNTTFIKADPLALLKNVFTVKHKKYMQLKLSTSKSSFLVRVYQSMVMKNNKISKPNV